MKISFLLFCFSILCFCEKPQSNQQVAVNAEILPIDSTEKTVISRFLAPEGYQVINGEGFGRFLQNLPLKHIDERVKYYNGAEKRQGNVYASVVDLPIGSKDLHQCADAIIRLRADYLRVSDQEDEIAFHFTNGFLCDYNTWTSGKRPVVNGNEVRWANGNKHQENYWKYLETVFTYAGTLSLAKELEPKPISELAIGDVFIQGGSPGHAVIVVNMAVNSQGKKKFMLAQSYMPAQEIQILNNPKHQSVWYDLPKGTVLSTPEWTFETTDLKSF